MSFKNISSSLSKLILFSFDLPCSFSSILFVLLTLSLQVPDLNLVSLLVLFSMFIFLLLIEFSSANFFSHIFSLTNFLYFPFFPASVFWKKNSFDKSLTLGFSFF